MGKQINVTVPDDIADLIDEIIEQTGRTQSSLCSDWIKDGAYKEVEQLKTVEGWRTLRQKSKKVKETNDD